MEYLGACLWVHLPHRFAGHAAADASLTRCATLYAEYWSFSERSYERWQEYIKKEDRDSTLGGEILGVGGMMEGV